MTEKAIQVQHLQKRFGEFEAVKNGTFEVQSEKVITDWRKTAGVHHISAEKFQSVLMPASILFAYALAFFGLAIWRFRFE